MPVAVAEFQQALAALAARLGTDVETLLKRTDQLDQRELLAFLTDAYPQLVAPYEAAAGELAAQYYSEQPSTTTGFNAEPAPAAPAEQLAASARWAATSGHTAQAAVSLLQGSANRTVMNASRETILHNVDREPGALWVRHASANACGFCRMLATRGAVYRSKASASHVVGRRGRTRGTRKMSDKYHDHCHCIAVPVRPGDTYTAPDYVKQWEADYREATKTVGMNPKAVAVEMDKIGAKRFAAEQHNVKVGKWLDAEDEHRHAVEYWRRVDAEDLHSIPKAQQPKPTPPPAPKETPGQRAEREFQDAVASGDDKRIDAALAELDRVDALERKAAARAAAAEERKIAKTNAQADEIVRLIDTEGWDPAEAEAHVTGRSVESIRRRNFIAAARADGHTGAGFDELVGSVHDRMVGELALDAEAATNGYMVKRQYHLTVNPKKLWSVNDATARKWMSEEMAAWFDQNGRLTRPILREMALRGEYSIGKFTAQNQDYLQ
jgi:hypothetical protein